MKLLPIADGSIADGRLPMGRLRMVDCRWVGCGWSIADGRCRWPMPMADADGSIADGSIADGSIADGRCRWPMPMGRLRMGRLPSFGLSGAERCGFAAGCEARLRLAV